MIRPASLITLSISALFLAVFLAPVSFATESRTTVNVDNNTGGNTVCVNGKCTTTTSNGKSEVCVNGKCFTGDDGDVNYQSEDGNTKVNITNNNSSVNVRQDSDSTIDDKVLAEKGKPTITPTVFKDVQGAKDELNKKKEEVKEKIAEAKKEFDFMKFFQDELASIKKLFSFEFLFGK